jgi:hypothetical protein
MSYRMELKKNDKNYPIPEEGALFRVFKLFVSTGKLFDPIIDAQLEQVHSLKCPHCGKEVIDGSRIA